ncbi:hypothetical protein F5879DRAFT_921858 [Lentinula edodes]|nr:hypothetical protein F5879DRAFT_921858 [Lentinula edodes]
MELNFNNIGWMYYHDIFVNNTVTYIIANITHKHSLVCRYSNQLWIVFVIAQARPSLILAIDIVDSVLAMLSAGEVVILDAPVGTRICRMEPSLFYPLRCNNILIAEFQWILFWSYRFILIFVFAVGNE